mgnify:CR=1 FL=1
MLNMLAGYDLDRLTRNERAHLLAEVMRRAYRDRAEYLGDPDFVDMPVERLIDPLYAAGLVRDIPPCGHVAGQYARTDLEVGVHKAPANAPLVWVQDVTLGVELVAQAMRQLNKQLVAHVVAEVDVGVLEGVPIHR